MSSGDDDGMGYTLLTPGGSLLLNPDRRDADERCGSADLIGFVDVFVTEKVHIHCASMQCNPTLSNCSGIRDILFV